MNGFTVDVAGARGAFDTVESGKKEAMRLARMNPGEIAIIEDQEGFPRFMFEYKDGSMHMTTIEYSQLIVDVDDE